MTVNEVLQLSAAGFSKAEILAMSKADSGSTEQKREDATPEEKKDVATTDFAKAFEELSERLEALMKKEEPKKEEPKKEEPKKEEPKRDTNDVIALLQSMNMAGQRYDLPPQYNPEDALAGALDAVMNGTKKGDSK